jgi:hypothetical protein
MDLISWSVRNQAIISPSSMLANAIAKIIGYVLFLERFLLRGQGLHVCGVIT